MSEAVYEKGDILETKWEDLEYVLGGALRVEDNDISEAKVREVRRELKQKLEDLGVPTEGNWVTMPKARYTKKRDGEAEMEKVLDFQGMIHIAPEQFYDRVQSGMDDHKGRVLFEGVESEKNAWWKKNPLKSLSTLMDKYKKAARYLKVTDQGTYNLQYPEAALRADVTDTDMGKQIEDRPPEEIRLVAKTIKLANSGINNFASLFPWEKMGSEMEKEGFVEKLITGDKDEERPKTLSGLHAIIGTFRDRVLSKVIEKVSKGEPSLMAVYGAGHLPGVHEELLKNGWELDRLDLQHVNFGEPMKFTWLRKGFEAFKLPFWALYNARSIWELVSAEEKEKSKRIKLEREEREREKQELSQRREMQKVSKDKEASNDNNYANAPIPMVPLAA